MDRIICGDTVNKNGTVNSQQQELFNQQMQNLVLNTQQQLTTLTMLVTSALPQPYKPPFTRWIAKTFEKVDIIAENKGQTLTHI